MTFLPFLRENARWIAGGFLLTFFSSFGQTFFISLSAGSIRAEYGLSHGQLGTLYMLATLASALTLPRLGQTVDRNSIRTVTIWVVPMLAVACALMGLSGHVVLLGLSIYLLRLFGQGMMNHVAFTAAGKWFSAQRGKAVSLTAIGVNAGEGLLPFAFVLVAGAVGWRGSWLVVALVLVVVATPVIAALVAVERQPRANDPAAPVAAGRDWTRGEALRDPLLYLLLLGVLAPPFIGTSVFFHQVYLVELRGWSMEAFAASFALSAAMTVAASLVSGQLIDRFTAVTMAPAFLLPLAFACLFLGLGEAQWTAFVFMALIGVTNGFSNTLFGALWPEVYGTAHLGAVRAAIVAIFVFSTAMGPGVTGFLIDRGVGLPAQITVMGVYCLVAFAVMILVSRRLKARLAAEAALV